MFDFRYHALSLVAVFLALTIGILLGVALGDSNLVSNAERDLRASLRGDVRSARSELEKQRELVKAQKSFENDLYPAVVGGKLKGMRVGIVAANDVSDETVRNVRASLQQTGATLNSVVVIDQPLDLAALAKDAGKGRYSELATKPNLINSFGKRIGQQYATDGKLFQRTSDSLIGSSSGRTSGLDAVVLVEQPKGSFNSTEKKIAESFFEGFIKGLKSRDIRTVGVERSDEESSQISLYQRYSVPSVDNIDQLPGHVSLVFLLSGANGDYGIKDSAESLIPQGIVAGDR